MIFPTFCFCHVDKVVIFCKMLFSVMVLTVSCLLITLNENVYLN